MYYLKTPSHEVRCTQQHTFRKWKRCVGDWTQAAPEAVESGMSRWLTHSMSSFGTQTTPLAAHRFDLMGSPLWLEQLQL